MKLLRTADDRFDNLPGYPFEPNYQVVKDRAEDVNIRIHYIDEGDPTAQPVLMLHGEPSWSFLYVPGVLHNGISCSQHRSELGIVGIRCFVQIEVRRKLH